MSDIIDKYKEQISEKKTLIKSKQEYMRVFEQEYEKMQKDLITYKAVYDKNKEKILKSGHRGKLEQIDAAYNQYVLRIKDMSNQVNALKNEINGINNEITTLQEKMEKEMANVYIIDVASGKTINKTYSFKVKDYDPISSNDELADAELTIRFLEIDFKPANKTFWLPKHVDIVGGHAKSLSINGKKVRVEVTGDTANNIKASVYIEIQICGIPQSSTTEVSASMERGTEVKGTVKAAEVTKSSKISLGLTNSWTNNFNGGSETCVFDLEYNCMGSKPKLTKEKISLPSEKDLTKIASPSEGWDNFLWSEGDHDLIIENVVNNLK